MFEGDLGLIDQVLLLLFFFALFVGLVVGGIAWYILGRIDKHQDA